MTAIPGGTHTYSKMRYAFNRVPKALHGDGCWVECDDGQGYVDTVAGLCAVSLGYQDLEVDVAIREQLKRGISFSLPTELEEEVGQDLLDFLDWGERVRFSKNGADVTNLAVRLARAHTGRDDIVSFDYHGHDDWYQALHGCAGVPIAFGTCVWGDPMEPRAMNDTITRPLAADVAAIILEPVPSDGRSRDVKALCSVVKYARDHGALVIYDCIITGMRLNRRGWPDDAPEPDLACYGKAMGNGMPLSACIGSAELMDRITEDVFFSTTFGGECLSLAAAQAVLKVYRERNVLDHFKATADVLNAKLSATAQTCGVRDQLEILSYPGRQIHKWRTPEQSEAFARAMIHEGILYQGYHNLMLATCLPDPVESIMSAYGVACKAVAAL